MRSVDTRDAVVAAGFVLAAIAEAVVRDHATPYRLAFEAAGALALSALALRRRRPVVTVLVLAAAGTLGALVDQLLWPDTPDSGGVWIFALMLATYSLGAHGSGRVLILGLLAPLLVVAASDLRMSGWAQLNGILFVTVFVGVLPTVAGRLVRVRHQRLRSLRDQHERIVEAQRVRQESVVLAERVSAMERLQPTLMSGLQELAATAEQPGIPAEVEDLARTLLTRTREEVLAMATPIATGTPRDLPPTDHVATLRAAAQPWASLAAGSVAAGLCVETTHVIAPSTPWWSAIWWGVAVGAPLALLWWRPLVALAAAWAAAAAYSRLLAPLDGSLSAAGLVFITAFAVAALSRRRTAMAGLGLCWLGLLVGVGADDPFGVAVIVLVCWSGGLAVNEMSRLVEQSRSNNELLAMQEEIETQRAVVEERLRLAREVHDSVGHSLTVAALQAGAARRLAETDPELSRGAMVTVAAVARDGVAALAAQDGGTDLVRLIEHVRAAGLVVETDLTDVHLLDPARRDIAVRVVQETLTNVLRHAPGARATVTVQRREDVVQIVVANSAPVHEGSGPGTGLGLSSIRERVTAGAGDVTWRTRDDGGFEVCAYLPMAMAESAQ